MSAEAVVLIFDKSNKGESWISPTVPGLPTELRAFGVTQPPASCAHYATNASSPFWKGDSVLELINNIYVIRLGRTTTSPGRSWR